ncbi:MAG: hypothetical protein O3A00_23315 [Planctomycetota bacterium]|nr:hypothetical protein [Planctomycetota bacterium]
MLHLNAWIVKPQFTVGTASFAATPQAESASPPSGKAKTTARASQPQRLV